MRVAVSAAVVVLGTSVCASGRAGDTNGSEPSSTLGTRRVLSLVVANLGLAGFAAGVVLGRDRQARDDSSAACSADVCHSMGSLLVEDLRAQNDTAFRLMTVGALAMFGGAALYLTAPSDDRKPSAPTAGIAIGTGGIMFKTTF